MFEFNDDDLFTNKSLLNRHDGAFYCCNASNSAEDQLAELARLVGGDSSTVEPKPQQISLVDTAPKLEFDLEGELTKAFDTVPYASVDQSAKYDMNSIEEAFAPPVQADPTRMPRVEDQAPSVDQSDAELSDLINLEFERALEEEELKAPNPALTPDATNLARVEKNFEAELSKLMGKEIGAAPFDKTPPPPEPVMAPRSEPEIVAAPELPKAEVQETPAPSNGEFAAPQMSDYDQAAVKKPSVVDPIDEFLAAQEDRAATDLHTEIVFDGASNLAAVAQSTNNEPNEIKVAEVAHAPNQNSQWDENSNKSFHDISIPEPAVIHEVIGRQRTGRKVAGSLLTIALLAGACLVGWNAYNGNPQNVPTILASSDPVKVKPKDAGGKVVPNQDQAVFKSVESDEKVKPQQKRLADNTEKPIAVATSSTGKAEVRVAKNDTSSTGGLPVQPRRVRTVVVKPDGTIINTSGSEAKPASAKVATTAPKKVEPVVKAKVAPKTLAKVEPVKEITPRKIEIKAPTTVDAKKVKTKVEEQVVATKPVINKPEVKKPEIKKPEVKAATVKKPEVKKPAVVAPKKVEPVKVAKVEPVKKAAPAKKPAKKVALPTVKSAYAVQISSQRSPEAAEKSYKTMARKYAAVLGGKGVDIRKAVIDGRGTYYRVRIPASSKTAANKLCSRLKSRGGDCLVTR